MIKLALMIFNVALLAGITMVSMEMLKKNSGSNIEYTAKKVQTSDQTGSNVIESEKTEINDDSGGGNTSVSAMLPEEKLKTVLENNIFSQKRCNPSVQQNNNPRQPGSMMNASTQLKLVGTFMVGESRGAIILQGRPGMMMPRIPNAPNQNNQNRPNPDAPNQNNQNRPNPAVPAMFSAGNVVYKQYVKVGETLSNGYQLVEVTRGKAVLSDGVNQIELELLQPSQNQTGKAAAQRMVPPAVPPW